MTEQERILEESKQIIQHCRGALDDLHWCQHTWLGNIPARSIKYEAPIMGDIMSVDKGRPEQYGNLFTLHNVKTEDTSAPLGHGMNEFEPESKYNKGKEDVSAG